VGCIPIHPFVGPSARWRPLACLRTRHGIFWCDLIAELVVSIKETLPTRVCSHWQLQTDSLARRRAGSRADATDL